jgi:hypothetical protein
MRQDQNFIDGMGQDRTWDADFLMGWDVGQAAWDGRSHPGPTVSLGYVVSHSALITLTELIDV